MRRLLERRRTVKQQGIDRLVEKLQVASSTISRLEPLFERRSSPPLSKTDLSNPEHGTVLRASTQYEIAL